MDRAPKSTQTGSETGIAPALAGLSRSSAPSGPTNWVDFDRGSLPHRHSRGFIALHAPPPG
ncbi:MAG: hypothetical protein EBY21_08390 [Alphaproteobacteria bacterium]|nr:hypothetical protein [Alphaproteobacteria bacterium]